MSNKQVITIVDYGAGNLFSVVRAFRYLGAGVVITADPTAAYKASRLLLPGVGAFGTAMENLKKRGLDEAICSFAAKGNPLLGICLGMQILFESSEEFGCHKGLGLAEGHVKKIEKSGDDKAFNFKIPHIGWSKVWSEISDSKVSGFGENPLMKSVKDGSFLYFVHSYAVHPANLKYTIASTFLGQSKFCSVFFKNNLFGCQFHPERSGEIGLQIYRNFLDIDF